MMPNKQTSKVLTNDISTLYRHIALLETILDKIHLGILMVDAEGKIIAYNNEMERYDGYKRDHLIGLAAKDAYDDFFYEPAIEKVQRTGKPLYDQRHRSISWDGRKTDILFDVHPFFHQKKFMAAYVVARGLDQIRDFVANTLEQQRRLSSSTGVTAAPFFFDDLVGKGQKIHSCINLARKMATRNAPIIIVGETGTGKDLFAQGLHNAGFFADGPFVAVNCASLPESLQESILFGTVKGAFTGASDLPGLFEQANGGTLFLDEINSMPLLLQAKLLRVLEEKKVRRIGGRSEVPVSCRIISATNANPFTEMQRKNIRMDLFFRLSTMILTLPPLRERLDDLQELINYFIQIGNREFGLSIQQVEPHLFELMMNYEWPGNIRELLNMIENAMNMVTLEDKTIKLSHLPEYSRKRLLGGTQTMKDAAPLPGLRHQLAAYEKKLIADSLKRHKGNINQTALALGLVRQNLHHKIRKYGL